MSHTDSTEHRLERLLFLGACLVSTLWMAVHGWVTEDAFITFRVVDHFVEGFGLRWNIAERVQVYTHPLWMFLHIPFYFFYRNIFQVTLILSWTCSIAAVALILKTFKRRPLDAVFFLLFPLALSKPLMEFSSSGLENPLTFLLFAAFGLALSRPDSKLFWFWMSLLPALSMLNRLDTAVFYGPITLYLVWRVRGRANWGQIVAGAMPLMLWEAFSVVYYGFPFPNTKYAKLNTGISSEAYVEQGLLYVFELWRSDAVSILLLAFGLGAAAYHLKHRPAPSSDRGIPFGALLVGTACYIAYVVSVGGDFMSGRFLTLPILVAAWLVYGTFRFSSPSRRAYGGWVTIWLLLKLVSVTAAQDFRPNGRDYQSTYGIADERRYYQNDSTLIAETGQVRTDFNPESFIRLEAEEYVKAGTDHPFARNNIGAFAYYAARPEWHIVDSYGLSEPLLARMPIFDFENWRIGHFERRFPDGLLKAVETGDTSDMQPDLGIYTQALQRVTRGPLFSKERWQDILNFNLGRYDVHLERYVEQIQATGFHNVLVVNNLGAESATVTLSLPTTSLRTSEPVSQSRTLDIEVPAFGFRAVQERYLWPHLGDEPNIYAVTVESDPPTVDARWYAYHRETRSGEPAGSAVEHGLPLTVPSAGSEPQGRPAKIVIGNLTADVPWPPLVGVDPEPTEVSWNVMDADGRTVAASSTIVEPGRVAVPPSVPEIDGPLTLTLASENGSVAPLGLTRRHADDITSKSLSTLRFDPRNEQEMGVLFPFLTLDQRSDSSISIYNPGSVPDNVRVTARISDGATRVAELPIPAGGVKSAAVTELFPVENVSNFNIRVSGTGPVAAVYRHLAFTPRTGPVGFSSALPLRPGSAGDPRGFGPAVAEPDQALMLGHLPTTLDNSLVMLTNLSSEPANVSLVFSDAEGNRFLRPGGRLPEVELLPFKRLPIFVSAFLHMADKPIRLIVTCDTAPIYGMAIVERAGYPSILYDAAVIDRPEAAEAALPNQEPALAPMAP